jgi:GT2 family glycosyltransferase
VRTAIIIPVFNGGDQLRACIASLSWARELEHVSVVVVDSGSTDGTLEFLAGEAAWAQVLPVDSGVWWTGATDCGCRHALADLGVEVLCLLNHDCRWSYEGYLALSSCLEVHPHEIVCSRVVDLAASQVVFSGGRQSRSGFVTTHWPSRSSAVSERERIVDWCGGMGVMFSTDTYAAIGGFDAAAFPHYFGDADFCLRARRRGIVTRYCPTSVVSNDTSTTGASISRESATMGSVFASLSSRKSVWNLRDNARFYVRHRGLLAPIALMHVYALWAGISAIRLTRSVFR